MDILTGILAFIAFIGVVVFLAPFGAGEIIIEGLDWLARKAGFQGIEGAARHGSTGVEGLLNREAIVVQDFTSTADGFTGRVDCDGTTWSAVAQAHIRRGSRVKILEVRGLTVVVSDQQDAG